MTFLLPPSIKELKELAHPFINPEEYFEVYLVLAFLSIIHLKASEWKKVE